MTVIVAVPFWLATGVTVTVRFAPLPPNTMLALGTNAVLTNCRSPSTSRRRLHVAHRERQRARGAVLVDRLIRESLIVGRSFCEVTVSRNVSLAEPLSPSVTVTVIVAVPDWFATGVTVTVRFAPLPPNTMFAFGTSAVFDELPVTTRFAAPCRRPPP